MKLTQDEIEKYFSINDIVASGGGRSYYRITEILPDRVRIQPTKDGTRSRLFYERLDCVINDFNKINPKQIEKSVFKVLENNDIQDTQNESYLYGMVKEYRHRKNNGKITHSYHKNEFKEAVRKASKLSSAERKERLKAAPKKPQLVHTTSMTYKRNPDVVAEVLSNAGKYCQRCGSRAPFRRAKDNTHYLEVHHKIPLADGGEDTIENAIPERVKHFETL